MKKSIKKILVFALAVCLLCGLCGCTVIDQMRECQAILQDDGTIFWNGSTYKLLYYSEVLYPEIDDETVLYVTMPEVPVLLSQTEAAIYVQPSTDGKFLEYLDDYGQYTYYCRTDCFDEISKRLSEDFVPEVYCYFYDVFDEENWEYNELHYALTADEVAAVELVTSTVEPYSANKLGRPEAMYSVYLYECSADMLLQQCTTELIATTAGYSILAYTDTDVMVFPVPEGMNATFDQILSAYISTAENTVQTDEELIV